MQPSQVSGEMGGAVEIVVVLVALALLLIRYLFLMLKNLRDRDLADISDNHLVLSDRGRIDDNDTFTLTTLDTTRRSTPFGGESIEV